MVELLGMESEHQRICQKKGMVINLAPYNNIRNIIQDFKMLNFEHKDDSTLR